MPRGIAATIFFVPENRPAVVIAMRVMLTKARSGGRVVAATRAKKAPAMSVKIFKIVTAIACPGLSQLP
jgi:hypothetical protein